MAHGKKQFAIRYCGVCNFIIQTIDYLKSQFSTGDLAFRKHCPKCRKHVDTKVKDQKNKS